MIKYVLCSISLISASCSFLCKLHLLRLNHINPPPLCATTVVLFCMAALIFPMGFYIKEVGGQPYKLPNNTVVGSSYVLFVLSIFFTIVGLLFAGKVCLPGWPGWAGAGALLEELLDLTHPRESPITCRAEQNWGADFSFCLSGTWKKSRSSAPKPAICPKVTRAELAALRHPLWTMSLTSGSAQWRMDKNIPSWKEASLYFPLVLKLCLTRCGAQLEVRLVSWGVAPCCTVFIIGLCSLFCWAILYENGLIHPRFVVVISSAHRFALMSCWS